MAPQTLTTTRDIIHPQIDARGGGNVAGGASIQEGNVKLLPWLIFTSFISGACLIAVVIVLIKYAQMENNMARMAVHMMSNDALLLRERIIQPGDMWYGPEGNLEYGRQDQPKQRK